MHKLLTLRERELPEWTTPRDAFKRAVVGVGTHTIDVMDSVNLDEHFVWRDRADARTGIFKPKRDSAAIGNCGQAGAGVFRHCEGRAKSDRSHDLGALRE